MITIKASETIIEKDYRGVAVLLPAHNEQSVVGQTIRGFQKALPGATVVVCDNCSTDETARFAIESGAIVIQEPILGKGNAIRRLLNSVDANIYVIADADTTYDPQAAVEMIMLMQRDHLDLVTGARKHTDPRAYRYGHMFGNNIFNKLFEGLFFCRTSDIFSGYRVISSRLARTLCIHSSGFEVETELTAIVASLKLSTAEVSVNYSPRPEGSRSKLNTYSDGLKILNTYFRLLRHFYPKRFYGFLSFLLGLTSLLLGIPLVSEFLFTGKVPRFPTAILASSVGVISTIFFILAILLQSLARNRLEQRQLILRLHEQY